MNHSWILLAAAAAVVGCASRAGSGPQSQANPTEESYQAGTTTANLDQGSTADLQDPHGRSEDATKVTNPGRNSAASNAGTQQGSRDSPSYAAANRDAPSAGSADSSKDQVHDRNSLQPASGPGTDSSKKRDADKNRESDSGHKADNSRSNLRDRSGDSLTPTDQGGGELDRKITQQIRQAVVGDKSLSFGAKNIKIITDRGKVTLRGPVKSETERSTIEAIAKQVAGVVNVENLLEISK